jgi:hypothetical protein
MLLVLGVGCLVLCVLVSKVRLQRKCEIGSVEFVMGETESKGGDAMSVRSSCGASAPLCQVQEATRVKVIITSKSPDLQVCIHVRTCDASRKITDATTEDESDSSIPMLTGTAFQCTCDMSAA